jgi:predicted permease
MAPASRRRRPLSTRAFRALLALYPAAFRDEYGRELALVFADRYRDAAGAWDRARLWVEALMGIVSDAPKEHCRMIRQDLRHAVRMLRQQPLVAATIVITLGIGIGANTAVFSLLNAIALRSPLPVVDADHLYAVNGGAYVRAGPESARLSGPMFERLRQAASADVGVAAMSRGIARVHTRTGDEPETTPASLQLVSPSFFPVLGLSPLLGRTLPADDGGTAADEPVAVISHRYWQRRFGAAPDVIGRTLTINGAGFTIVGVGPAGFVGVWLETPVDIWVPLAMQPVVQYTQSFTADGADLDRPWLPQPQIWWLHVVARVPSGHAPLVARTFNASVSELTGRDAGIVLEPFGRGYSRVRQQFWAPLVALLAMAALVLLVACANVANILLARAVSRQREIAVRMALGAGRVRIVQQFLTESILLVAMAGLAALLMARWAADVLMGLATVSTDAGPPLTAPLDVYVLAFAAGAAFLSVLTFGVWPAWRATRSEIVTALNAGARGAVGGGGRPARVLVVAQVAVSLVLVTATGVFVRSFQYLSQADLGVERERLLTIGIDPRLSGVPHSERHDLYRQLLESVVAVPGVEAAALAMCGLQGSCAVEDGFAVEGYEARQDERIAFSVDVVSPGYFSAVGMRLVAGRALGESDDANAPRVAVVNRTLAGAYFKDPQRALGRRIGLGQPSIEIVGIVEDARGYGNVKAAPRPAVFVPIAQRPVVPRRLEVRTAIDPASLTAYARRAIAGVSPGLPIEGIDTVDAHVARSLAQDRTVVLLTFLFGGLALGLAGIGLFGVLSYTVARRRQEIGLRLALGAPRSRVLRSVVRDGLALVLFGIAAGLPFVFVGGTLIAGLIVGPSPHDWTPLAVAIIVLSGVGVLCSLHPALRASRVDPMVALRQE